MKPQPKDRPKVDKKYRKFLTTQPCCLCGRIPSIPAHQRDLSPCGTGIKPDDRKSCLPLCHSCHDLEHHGAKTFWKGCDRKAMIEKYNKLYKEEK